LKAYKNRGNFELDSGLQHTYVVLPIFGSQTRGFLTLHIVSLLLFYSKETDPYALLLPQISDVLDFSKIEAGTLELEAAPFSIRQCLEEAADLVAARAADKGLQLATHTHATIPPTVIGDVSRLRQVLVSYFRKHYC
jgi:hypothetical protein